MYLHFHRSVPTISSKVSRSLTKCLLLIIAHMCTISCIVNTQTKSFDAQNELSGQCLQLNIVDALLLHYHGH